MKNDQFKEWLKTITWSFSEQLSDVQKCSALNSLIKACGPVQLHYLSELQHLMRRDFLKWLPLELSYLVIKYLDIDSLKTCCLVSKHWNAVVNGCADIWLNACHILGLNTKYDACGKDGNYWKSKCRSLSNKIKSLKDGKAFTCQTLKGHTGRITSLVYENGYLASGCDDLSVRIWNVHNGVCEKVIQTHSCADINFEGTKLVTGSFNCSVGLWDMQTGRNIGIYVGHTSKVNSVDLNVDAQIIVSGSADRTVKVWLMNQSQECLQTFHGYQSRVLKVILKRSSVDSVSHRQGDLVLLGMDSYDIKIWPVSGESTECLGNLSLPAWQNEEHQLLPYFQFNGSKIICTTACGVHVFNFQTLQHERFIECGNLEIKLLVSYGSTFNLSLSRGKLVVRNSMTNHPFLAEFDDQLTHLFHNPIRSFTAGEKAWLNGFGIVPETGLIFAGITSTHSIVLVKWV